MSLEDPISYADWYWKHSVDAHTAISEAAEKVYAPIVSQLLDSPEIREDIPDSLKPLFEFLKSPSTQGADTLQVVLTTAFTRFWSTFAGEVVSRPSQYAAEARNVSKRIDADIAVLLRQRKLMTKEFYETYASYQGYDETEAEQLYSSRLPYPTIPEIIGMSRYIDPTGYPKESAMKLFDIPENVWDVWNWSTWQRLTTEQVQSLYVRDTWDIDRTDTELRRLGWQRDDLLALHNLAYEIPNAMLMLQSDLVQGKSEVEIAKNIAKAGIHPEYAIDYVNAILTKPASEDVIAYELRRDPNLSNLDTELRKIGIHPNYNSLYKELAYQIPPVADIITMAVREAFTPAIAARFGQYEDLPSEFVEWVQKKGLSKEWAERYWAAHWSLPSPQQGFEMLHRGVIGEGDLNMLMRALDIMPFWRDKLTQIAYRPLSRVDVRRMFALGVLDVSGIRKAYTDLGYNDYNADLMTKFTIEYVKGVPKKLSTADIISAYKKHLIESVELSSQLAQAGIESEDIQPIIKTAQQRREWSDREDNITTIEFLYKQGKYTEDKTKTELRNLRLTDDYIENLLPQWTAKSIAEKETLWTQAQTLKFMQANLITKERGKQELTDLGYDAEHINVYLASVVPVQ